MSLHAAAQHLAGKGRGRDTTLVHMSPREVRGLQALAKAQGGSLSINPDTGLVEAGFLEQALPIVAAAAATYFTAGAAAPALSTALGSTMAGGILAGAGAGALIGGGSAALQNKDVGQAALYGGVGGAIAGGTGAYADTGVNTMFSGATPATDVASAATPAVTAAPGAINPVSGMPQAATDTAVNAAYGPLTAPPVTPPAPIAPQTTGLTVDEMIAGSGRPQLSGQTNTFDPYAKLPGEKLGLVPTPGSDFYATSNPLTKAGLLALPGMGAAAADKTNMPGGEQYDPNSPYRWRIANSFQGSTPVQPNPYYQASYPKYADGGMVAMAPGGLASLQGNMYPQSQQDMTQFATPTQMPISAEVVRSDYEPKTDPYSGQLMMAKGGMLADQKKKKASLTSAAKMAAMDSYDASVAGLGNAMYQSQMPGQQAAGLQPTMQMGQLNLANGGISNLGGYSDGGRMLKGRGDGMSDSIPASIAGKQPARLADGEFVVPADVVSHLGNGSTDAGAKRLYAMMDKVRQARTGKKKQAPAVNSKRLMPA
jgi:hypothetical protein